MAIGANYAGVRAFTASSGPGLSLMMEAIGLSGMTETPLVIVNTQRGDLQQDCQLNKNNLILCK